MSILVAGLVLFLGVHSIRIVADDWRTAQIARLGERPWKLGYTVVSLVGFGLIIWGFGLARASTGMVWSPPAWTSPVAAALLLPAFVLIVAGNMPGTKMKAALGHPMTAGVGLWALGHLLANGRLDAVLLFGAFVVWSAIAFATRRARDRASGTRYPPGSLAKDTIAAVAGIAFALVFALFLHGPLIGLRPFG